jgi:ferric-dicitrate binding protein FerR (iron transport regulator)
MTRVKITGETRRWLADRSFLAWCLAPDPAADAAWNDYMKAHPAERAAIEEARRVALTARLNACRRAAAETGASWQRVERAAPARRARHRGRRLARHAAACLLLSCAGAAWALWQAGRTTPGDYPLAGEAADSTRAGIVLVTADSSRIAVENDAVITCDARIVITSGGEQRVRREIPVEPREQHHSLVVPRGRRTTVLLPDGTKVWVGPGTTLRFPSRFAAGERVIEAEGEIYVEVARDTSRPFRVETSRLGVRATGTRFNVSAHADEEEHSVVLAGGSVSVTVGERSVTLSPGQRLVSRGESLEIEEVDARDYTSWKDGLLSFRDETTREVLQRLGRYYNVSIACSREIADKRIAGKLVLFDDVGQVMMTFSTLLDARHATRDGTIFIE